MEYGLGAALETASHHTSTTASHVQYLATCGDEPCLFDIVLLFFPPDMIHGTFLLSLHCFGGNLVVYMMFHVSYEVHFTDLRCCSFVSLTETAVVFLFFHGAQHVF